MFKRTLVFTLLLVFVVTLSGCGGPSKAERLASESITLDIWRVFDTDDSFREIMSAYQAIHPNVSFNYRRLRIDEYEDELIRAFAEGEGPDIFSVHNTWMGEYQNLIAPLPQTLTIPYTEVKGTIKKETIFTLREEPTIRPSQVQKEFIDVVGDDVIRSYRPDPRAEAQNRIFGLPMAVDTLSLFYNKDLLNAAGIAEPPRTWTEFQEATIALTRIGSGDQIIQSGVAMGTSRNVERSFDIVSALMMQNGTRMVNDRGQATFSDSIDGDTVPGALAMQFYTDFANPLKEVFSWNSAQQNSFEAFINGKAAFFLGYAYHVPFINSRAPKLRYDISELPQIQDGRVVNYANYWNESVSKATKHVDWAWDFVQFATSEEQVTKYLAATNKPTARRALIKTQIDNATLSSFAAQLLTAKSWYKGRDAAVAEEAILDLIDAFLTNADNPDNQSRAMKIAENKVNQSL